MPIASQVVSCRLRRGFTLIEVMIVVALLGILAGVISYVSLGSQKKARDGVRKSDLNQVKRALELAKTDCRAGAYYPKITAGTNYALAYTNLLTTYLMDADLKYISSNPTDPKNTDPQKYKYGNDSANITNACPATDGTGNLTTIGSENFALWVQLEITNDPDSTKSRTKCNGKPDWLSPNWLHSDRDGYGYYVVCND